MPRFVLIFITLATLAALWACLAFLLAPAMAQSRLAAALEGGGFDTTLMPAPERYYGTLVYKNIPLDKDQISSIQIISVSYSPLQFLWSGLFEKLEISGISLTGEWNNQLSLAGWKIPDTGALAKNNMFRTISITKSRLSILTQQAGGISVFFDAEAQKKASKTEFQAHLNSEQKTLGFTADVSGILASPSWYAEIEIGDGKYETDSDKLKISRLNSHLNFTATPNAPLKILGDFQAGGLVLYGLPWRDFSGSLEFQDIFKLLSEAKSLGPGNIELSLNMVQKRESSWRFGGSIHADQARTLADFLKDRPVFYDLRRNILRLGNKAADIDFLQEPDTDPMVLKYKIGDNYGLIKPE